MNHCPYVACGQSALLHALLSPTVANDVITGGRVGVQEWWQRVSRCGYGNVNEGFRSGQGENKVCRLLKKKWQNDTVLSEPHT